MLIFVQYFLLSKEGSHLKVRAYECGFLSSTKRRSQVRVQYFTLLILFIIFDLEVVLLLPMLLNISGVLYFLVFFMVLRLLLE